MVSASITPSKSKEKQLALSSEESNVEYFSGLKKIPVETEEIYQSTRMRTGAIALVEYNALAWAIEVSNEHSPIAESQSSNSYMLKEAFAYMVGTPIEMIKRLEKQPRMQQA